jgi:hypothetical protein
LEAEEEYAANLKFMLFCFENMSGLKITFHKSEVIVVGVSKEEGARIANYLNCREGVLPMKYMGIPVNICKMYTSGLMYVGLKVEKRLPAWQGLMLSFGGNAILIESYLSSQPNYTIGLYLLSEEVHHKMDLARANFYLDSRQKKEVSCGKVGRFSQTQGFGGLGFNDTRLMNKCFISKWIIKLERGDEDLCSRLLRNKYLKDMGFFCTKARGAHNFGRGCMRQNIYVRVDLNMRWVMKNA